MREVSLEAQRYLLVVSGPSGCGKDTVVQQLIMQHENIELSVSATTRAPRGEEKNGVHYYFLKEEEFEKCVQEDDLLEYACYVGKCYGTLRSEVERRMQAKITCVLVIEVEGMAKVKELYPECTTVFILPPSIQELERRLRGRGFEDEAWVKKRMARAEEEIPFAKCYDYTLINSDVSICAQELYEILRQRQP